MATSYNPVVPGATGYTSTQADLNGYKSADQQSTGYAADTVNPYGKASVSDNLTSMLDENSPLMQRASQKGLIAANQRGLLNSSMAAGASQAALYDMAIPLATSDAQLFSQNQQFNSGAINRAREFGAGAANAAFTNNAQAANTAAQFTADANNRESLANQQSRDSASQFAAAASNRAAEVGAANQNQAGQFNAEQANLEQRLSMDNQNKIGLANIEANYKNIIQTSNSAQEVVKSYQAGVAQITQNKDLDAVAKQAAIQQMYNSTEAALAVLGGIANLNLTGAFPDLVQP